MLRLGPDPYYSVVGRCDLDDMADGLEGRYEKASGATDGEITTLLRVTPRQC